MDTQTNAQNTKTIKEQLRANLLYSAYWLSDLTTEFLKHYDITQQQFNVLTILGEQHPEPISTKQIRERMIISNSDTSRLIDRLCDKGLAWKRPCPHDGRLIQAFIHEKGQTLLGEIGQNMGKLDDVMCNITEAEATVMSKLLNKMRFHSKEKMV
ncbi:MarR family transcriptional regulator [uncultured Roseivirga sp.]|uniref:MarR family winged helix-turn-helix transcriptional regulator n=1 Tax=uncultured Roseivirga sp. TaxID=543088 RepID=UPI0030D7B7BC|tara:strand:+ start:1976 stop:2440 length:465 start_codon:yes stop_codon:yes gene_type:complete